MSNPDQPRTPPLTRRQLREMRNTGSTEVVRPSEPVPDEAAPEPVVETGSQETAPTDGHRESGIDPDIGVGDRAADDGESRDDAGADVPIDRTEHEDSAGVAGEVSDADADEVSSAASAEPTADEPPAPAHSVPPAGVDLGVARLTRRQAREQERIRTASVPVIAPDAPTPAEVRAADSARVEAETSDGETSPSADDGEETRPNRGEPAPSQESDVPVTVSPRLGSALLNGRPPEVDLPPSFDHLLTRESATTGAVTAPSALILSQTPSGASLTSPIAATGEILVTGTFALPEGLGSRGHAAGTTDGKEADAVLIDGELPASSSPTPIAASAAISTVRSAEEIIRPPAPEKGSRLTLALAITAGALGLALVAVLIVSLVSGAWS